MENLPDSSPLPTPASFRTLPKGKPSNLDLVPEKVYTANLKRAPGKAKVSP
jgi:hypothetical protein